MKKLLVLFNLIISKLTHKLTKILEPNMGIVLRFKNLKVVNVLLILFVIIFPSMIFKLEAQSGAMEYKGNQSDQYSRNLTSYQNQKNNILKMCDKYKDYTKICDSKFKFGTSKWFNCMSHYEKLRDSCWKRRDVLLAQLDAKWRDWENKYNQYEAKKKLYEEQKKTNNNPSNRIQKYNEQYKKLQEKWKKQQKLETQKKYDYQKQISDAKLKQKKIGKNLYNNMMKKNDELSKKAIQNLFKKKDQGYEEEDYDDEMSTDEFSSDQDNASSANYINNSNLFKDTKEKIGNIKTAYDVIKTSKNVTDNDMKVLNSLGKILDTFETANAINDSANAYMRNDYEQAFNGIADLVESFSSSLQYTPIGSLLNGYMIGLRAAGSKLDHIRKQSEERRRGSEYIDDHFERERKAMEKRKDMNFLKKKK